MKTLSVYRYINTVDRVCDMECTHKVSIHQRVVITVLGTARRWVDNLNYDTGGYAECDVAVDESGSVFIYHPSWDGPGPYVNESGDAFWRSPILTMDAAYTDDGDRIVPFHIKLARKRAYKK